MFMTDLCMFMTYLSMKKYISSHFTFSKKQILTVYKYVKR